MIKKLPLYESMLKVSNYIEVNEDSELYNSFKRKINIDDPKKVYLLFKSIYEPTELDKEVTFVIALDAKLNLINFTKITTGTANSTILHPRDAFKPAILNNAVSIIVVHNHPSGDPAPSKQDNSIYDTLKEAGKYLGIAISDFIIIGDDCFYSFALCRKKYIEGVER